MKVEARIFLVVAAFCWLAAIIYGIWTDQRNGHVEAVGVAALILSGGLLASRLVLLVRVAAHRSAS